MNLSTTPEFGVKLLRHAIHHGREEMVKFLLQSRAIPDGMPALPHVTMPITLAASAGHRGILTLLVEARADLYRMMDSRLVGHVQWQNDTICNMLRGVIGSDVFDALRDADRARDPCLRQAQHADDNAQLSMLRKRQPKSRR